MTISSNTLLPKKAYSKFTSYCLRNLDFDEPDQFDEYFSCIPLCAINAIFSINTRYKAVQNAIERFCEHFDLEIGCSAKGRIPPVKNQKTVTQILNLVKNIKPEYLAARIFKNRQRTSTTNGILKADAAVKFMKVLKDFKVETYQDIRKVYNNESFHTAAKQIPGQSSGVSLRYFFMTAGTKDQIKPDRWILRFIEDATGLTVKSHQALDLVRYAVQKIRAKGYSNLSARHLDNLMWNYQSR